MSLPESEQKLLEREGKTISLTEKDVQDASRLLRLLVGDEKSPDLKLSTVRGPVDRSREWLRSKAGQLLRDRQLRSDYFNRAIFSEAAWDILLVLYVTDSAGARQTQATLSKQLATPPTTVQRWIDYLEKEHLVRRNPHPNDRRVSFVTLLENGRKALDNYLSAIGS